MTRSSLFFASAFHFLVGTFACGWYLWARTAAYRALVDIGWGAALARVSVAFIITSTLLIALMHLVVP